MEDKYARNMGYKNEVIIDAKKFLETFILESRKKSFEVSESTYDLLAQIYSLLFTEYRILDKDGKEQKIETIEPEKLIEKLAKKEKGFKNIIYKMDQETTRNFRIQSNYCDYLIRLNIDECKNLQSKITGFDFYCNYKPEQFKELEGILADSYKEQDALEKAYDASRTIALVKKVKVKTKIKSILSKPLKAIKAAENER